jgi:hypothetical protein
MTELHPSAVWKCSNPIVAWHVRSPQTSSVGDASRFLVKGRSEHNPFRSRPHHKNQTCSRRSCENSA